MTTVAPNSASEMAWEIGDRGFNMTLSSYVPNVIATRIGEVADAALACAGRTRGEIAWWAVHPGGKAILDKVERRLGLAPRQLEPSREVLREFGNMSSATVLFTLRRLMARADVSADSPVHAMAFGPGLTIESATLRLVGAVPQGARAAGHAVGVFR
jgi:predicted naringenin-chalcone synthase